MAAQFDLYRLPGGQLVVVLQSDLLDDLRTRVVAPLVPATAVRHVLATLNPTVVVGEETYLFMPQLAATLARGEMGARVGSLAMMQDSLLRAVDALLSGI